MANPLSWISSKIASIFSSARGAITRIWGMGTTEVYPDPNVNNAIGRGFNSNTAVYSIVKKAAKKFGSVPRYVEPKGQEGKSESEVIEGPLMDLLDQPNDEQGQDAFFSLLYACYKVCGEAFIWLNRGDTDTLIEDILTPLDDEAHSKKPVLEMFIIPANKIVINPDPDNPFGILSYQLLERPDIKFRKVDIIHWKDINLEFDLTSRPQLRGFSPLVAGMKTLTQNNSATDAAVRMYQNSGAKGVMINKLGGQNPMQESQVNRVMDKINDVDAHGAVRAFQGDWSYAALGLTSVDMELLKGKQMSMQELCFLLGMPYEFFDSQVTYANKQEAQKGWVINEIMPDCKQLDGEMSRVLLKAFGLEKTATICSDFDDLPELQEDKSKQIEWLMKGPFTVNEVREATGYEPSDEEGADEILLPSNLAKLADLTGDGGEQIMQDLYANGRTNTGNGNGKISQNGKGKLV
jgi:HK97 family phage portal protein